VCVGYARLCVLVSVRERERVSVMDGEGGCVRVGGEEESFECVYICPFSVRRYAPFEVSVCVSVFYLFIYLFILLYLFMYSVISRIME